MKTASLITFEGIEGCGKSTQLQLLARYLDGKSIPYHSTREPGGTEIGIQIRKILLSEKTVQLSGMGEALLYMADRFQHIAEVIRPALQQGKMVLCDRYHDSTVAYQGYARKIPLEFLDFIWKRSAMAVEPDLTFLIDVQPEVGLKRSIQKLQQNRLDESRFEKETLAFHASVREGFLVLAKQFPDRIVLVDGSGSEEEVHRQILERFEVFLEAQ